MLRTSLVVCGVLLLTACCVESTVDVSVRNGSAEEPSFDDVEALFEYFKAKFHRTYDGEEHARRFGYFEESVRAILQLRESNPLAQFGLTEMSDHSPLERQRRRGFVASKSATPSTRFVSDPPSIQSGLHTLDDLPAAIDWREKGALNPVRDQMQCGSCWAFAIIAVTESQWFLKHNELPVLSEQMLVSCDPNAGGCNGAYPSDAIQGIVDTFSGNVTLRSSYPYVSHLGYAPPCDKSFFSTGAVIHSVVTLESTEDAMLKWVGFKGPIGVAIDANSLEHYHGGIITNATSTQQDHAVVVVGYGEENNTPYWIVRNSWSSTWGEQGYFRLIRGINAMLISLNPYDVTVV